MVLPEMQEGLGDPEEGRDGSQMPVLRGDRAEGEVIICSTTGARPHISNYNSMTFVIGHLSLNQIRIISLSALTQKNVYSF